VRYKTNRRNTASSIIRPISSRTWNKGDLKVSGAWKDKFKFSGITTAAITLFSEQGHVNVREDMCHGLA